MSVKTRDLGMTPLDDLFSTDESRAESQFEKVVTLNPAEISDFPNHPFKVKQDDRKRTAAMKWSQVTGESLRLLWLS